MSSVSRRSSQLKQDGRPRRDVVEVVCRGHTYSLECVWGVGGGGLQLNISDDAGLVWGHTFTPTSLGAYARDLKTETQPYSSSSVNSSSGSLGESKTQYAQLMQKLSVAVREACVDNSKPIVDLVRSRQDFLFSCDIGADKLFKHTLTLAPDNRTRGQTLRYMLDSLLQDTDAVKVEVEAATQRLSERMSERAQVLAQLDAFVGKSVIDEAYVYKLGDALVREKKRKLAELQAQIDQLPEKDAASGDGNDQSSASLPATASGTAGGVKVATGNGSHATGSLPGSVSEPLSQTSPRASRSKAALKRRKLSKPKALGAWQGAKRTLYKSPSTKRNEDGDSSEEDSQQDKSDIHIASAGIEDIEESSSLPAATQTRRRRRVRERQTETTTLIPTRPSRSQTKKQNLPKVTVTSDKAETSSGRRFAEPAGSASPSPTKGQQHAVASSSSSSSRMKFSVAHQSPSGSASNQGQSNPTSASRRSKHASSLDVDDMLEDL